MELDEIGVMSEKDSEYYMFWIKNKWPKTRRECDVCRSWDEWIVARNFVTSMVIIDNKIAHKERLAYPQIMMSCKKCANTKYFSKVIMDTERCAAGPF